MLLKKPVIGIFGATGLVGSEIVSLIEEKNFLYEKIRLFASADSVGEYYKVGTDEIAVEALSPSIFNEIDLCFFALPDSVIAEYLAAAEKAHCHCVVSASERRRESVIVPELVRGKVRENERTFFTPQSSTVHAALLISAVQKLNPEIKSVSITVLEPCATAGRQALDELWEQVKGIYNQTPVEPQVFPASLAFNVIPKVGEMYPSGESSAEVCLREEMRSIFGENSPAIFSSIIRVPVLHGSTLSLECELTGTMPTREQVIAHLAAVGQFRIIEEDGEVPQATEAVGCDELLVGRIRVIENRIQLVSTADTVRRLVAANMLGIAERIVLPQ